MCYASKLVFETVAAVAGKSYRVSQVGDIGHPAAALHEEDAYFRGRDAKLSCAACVTEPMLIELTGVPSSTQEKYGLCSTIRGTFDPGDGEGREDMILLRGHAPIPFYEFAGFDTQAVLSAIPARAGRKAVETLAA